MIRNNFCYRRDPETARLLDIYTELSPETQEQITADVLLLKSKLVFLDDKKRARKASIQAAFEITMKTYMYLAEAL